MNCCVGKVQIQCLPMCYIDSPGHLHEQLMPCMGDTDAIIECFSTGIKGIKENLLFTLQNIQSGELY